MQALDVVSSAFSPHNHLQINATPSTTHVQTEGQEVLIHVSWIKTSRCTVRKEHCRKACALQIKHYVCNESTQTSLNRANEAP